MANQPTQDLLTYAHKSLDTEFNRSTTRVAYAVEDFRSATNVANSLADSESQKHAMLQSALADLNAALIDNAKRIQDRCTALLQIAEKTTTTLSSGPSLPTLNEHAAEVEAEVQDNAPEAAEAEMEDNAAAKEKKKNVCKKLVIYSSDEDYDENNDDSSGSLTSSSEATPARQRARKNTRKRKDDDDDDDWIVSSDEGLEVYDDPKFDNIFKGRPPTNKKRVAKKVKLFEVQPDDKTRGAKLTDPSDVVRDANDTEAAKDFFALIQDGVDLSVAISTSDWFTSRYAVPIDLVRQNCGFQTSNRPALEVWTAMVDIAFKREGLCKLKSCKAQVRKCCLCNIKRNVNTTFTIDDTQHYIGGTCAKLAFAVTAFYSDLHKCAFYNTNEEIEESIKMLDQALEKIQRAHALKGKSK